MRFFYGLVIWIALAGLAPTVSPIVPAHAAKTAAERAAQLDTLFAKLQTAKSDEDADLIVADIWAMWNLSGSEQIDEIMQRAQSLMHMGALGMALEVLDDVVRTAPDYAEGWNRRATVLFFIGQYDRSWKDCEEVLRREPRHFGALAGMGMIALTQGRHSASLEAFRRALKVNPFMKERRELIPALERKVGGREL